MALNRVPFPSPNYSSRGGSGVRLVVLHTAEGSTSIESLGAFFSSASAGVSSHTGIDNKENTVGEFVRPEYKSWTAANFNPVAVQTELCAFAAWSLADWHSNPNLLRNCAAWVAEECARFNIPVVRLTPGQAQGSGRGVCQHVDLGSGGGGHWDCGPGFPMDEVIGMASGGLPAPPPAKRSGAVDLVRTSKGYYIFAADGGVFCFGNAQFYGSLPGMDIKPNTPIVGGAVTNSERGYWVAAEDGGVFSFGDAQFDGSMGGTKLNQPVVGIEADPDGRGYWLLGKDGGVFSFNAPFYGAATGHIQV